MMKPYGWQGSCASSLVMPGVPSMRSACDDWNRPAHTSDSPYFFGRGALRIIDVGHLDLRIGTLRHVGFAILPLRVAVLGAAAVQAVAGVLVAGRQRLVGDGEVARELAHRLGVELRDGAAALIAGV